MHKFNYSYEVYKMVCEVCSVFRIVLRSVCCMYWNSCAEKIMTSRSVKKQATRCSKDHWEGHNANMRVETVSTSEGIVPFRSCRLWHVTNETFKKMSLLASLSLPPSVCNNSKTRSSWNFVLGSFICVHMLRNVDPEQYCASISSVILN
jgi:hypothetical protein